MLAWLEEEGVAENKQLKVLNSLDRLLVAAYLNEIGEVLDRAFKKHSSAGRELPALKRLWTAHFHLSLIDREHGDGARILLVDVNQARRPTSLPYNGGRPTWLNLYSIAHVLSDERLTRSAMNDHDVIAYFLFLIQHRSWTPQILVITPIQYLFSVTTWQSKKFSVPLNLDHPGELCLFLEVLIGLMFFDNDAVGFGADLGTVEGDFDATVWEALRLQLQGRIFALLPT